MVAVTAVAITLLRDRLPGLDDVWRALTRGDRRWFAAAVVAEVVSIGFFAEQQRRLLRAFGVAMTIPRAESLAFARSAIAISLPAGSALSAGFAFRQFRLSGANRPVAATVMVLSGLASTLALVLLYLTGLLAAALGPTLGYARDHPRQLWGGAVAVSAVLAAVCVGAAIYGRQERPHASKRARIDAVLLGPLAHRWPRVGRMVKATRDALASIAEVPRRHWNTALLLAGLNWATDLACLYFSVEAFGMTVSPTQLAALYLGIQVVRQIPVTPGGVGLIEASLLAGLLSAGAPEDGAAAAVLVYRLLSCWLIIPVGVLAWARLRRTPIAGGGETRDDDGPEQDGPAPESPEQAAPAPAAAPDE
jgi:hypothetical protein